MNTFSQLAVEIADTVGDASEAGLARATRELPRTLRALAMYRNYAWSFFRDLTGEITLTGGTASYLLGADVQRVTSVWYNDGGTYVRLHPMTERDWANCIDHSIEDYPVGYRIEGFDATRVPVMYLGPTPSDAFAADFVKLYYEYQAKPVTAAAEGVTTPNYPDGFETAIIYYAAARVCAVAEDYTKAAAMNSMAAAELDMLLREDALRYNAQPGVVKVTDVISRNRYSDNYGD